MAVLNPYNYKRPAGQVANIVKKPELKAIRPTQEKTSQQDMYLEQKVMSAKPEELTLMLYEGLVKFIKMSCLYIEQKNMQKAHEINMKAQAIVVELRATLNMDYEISNEFDALYEFVLSRLFDGNIKKEVQPLKEALEIAEELHDTWKQAMTLA